MGRLAKIYQKQALVKLVGEINNPAYGEVNFCENHIFEALWDDISNNASCKFVSNEEINIKTLVQSSEQRCVLSIFNPMKTIYQVDKLGHLMTVKLGIANQTEKSVTEQKL